MQIKPGYTAKYGCMCYSCADTRMQLTEQGFNNEQIKLFMQERVPAFLPHGHHLYEAEKAHKEIFLMRKNPAQRAKLVENLEKLKQFIGKPR